MESLGEKYSKIHEEMLRRGREILGQSVYIIAPYLYDSNLPFAVLLPNLELGVDVPRSASMEDALSFATENKERLLAIDSERQQLLEERAKEEEVARKRREQEGKEREARAVAEWDAAARARIRGAIAEARVILGEPYDPQATVRLAEVLMANVRGGF